MVAARPKDFAYQVSITNAFLLTRLFSCPAMDSLSRSRRGIFVYQFVICIRSRRREEAKKDGFSEIYERLVETHDEELPDFKIRVWARMLVSKTNKSIMLLIRLFLKPSFLKVKKKSVTVKLFTIQTSFSR